jgi:hypothetical protein
VGAAADLKPPASAVVDLSGPTEMSGTNALGVVPKVTSPILFLAGADDAFSREVTEVSRAATHSTDNRLEIVPGSPSHGASLLNPAEDAKADQTSKLLLDFVARHTAG